MSTLLEDIKVSSDWTVTAFQALGINMDYSIESIKHINDIIEANTSNGQAKPDGLLATGLGGKLFLFASYLGETLIKNAEGSEWVTDDNDPQGELHISVQFSNGDIVWPAQRVMGRHKNGAEDCIYVYVRVIVDSK